jgi:hypothetical protein
VASSSDLNSKCVASLTEEQRSRLLVCLASLVSQALDETSEVSLEDLVFAFRDDLVAFLEEEQTLQASTSKG